jgi:hypothetical protein
MYMYVCIYIYIYIWNGFWNVKILKSSLCCVHLELLWNGSPSLMLFLTTGNGVIEVYILWQTLEWFTLVGTHGSRDCCLSEGVDTRQSGVAYVTCSVFLSRRKFLVLGYWCSSRVFPSDRGCHCKASWDYVPLYRVNLCMEGTYRCF